MKLIDLPSVVTRKIPHPTKWRHSTYRSAIYAKAGNKTTTKVYMLKHTFIDKTQAHRVAALITAQGTITVKNWKAVKTL